MWPLERANDGGFFSSPDSVGETIVILGRLCPNYLQFLSSGVFLGGGSALTMEQYKYLTQKDVL